MSNRAYPVNWSIRYFPQKGALPVTLIVWGAYFLVFMAGAVAWSIIYDDPAVLHYESVSVWGWAFLLGRVIALVIGVLLIGHYLRLHVAHGQTRHGFMCQATAFLVVCSAALAAVATLGFELEFALYQVDDWAFRMMADEYAYGAARFPGVFFMIWAQVVTWMVAGMLVTAGIRRFKLVSLLLTIPLAVAMIVLVEDAVGYSNFVGPSPDLQNILIGPAMASILLSLGASWGLTRRVSI